MTTITVHYDARCGLCCAVRDWIARQPQLVPVQCVPAAGPTDELVVAADSGEVWSGDSAWLMVLWALAEYRSWSYRLSSPALLPIARQMFATLSKYRDALSCALPALSVAEGPALSGAEGPALSRVEGPDVTSEEPTT